MIVRLICSVSLGLVLLPVLAEDINFSDLQRPGAGLSRSTSVPGLAIEGASFVSRFSEVDSARIEDLRRSRASSSGSTGSSGSASSNANWIITSEANSGPLTHWSIKEYWGKCTSGRKSGELFKIHLLKSGGYQVLSRSVKKSLSESALDACS